MATQIKGINVNGVLYNANATSIGTYLTANGKDFKITVDENGNVYGYNSDIRTEFGSNDEELAFTSDDGTVYNARVLDDGRFELYRQDEVPDTVLPTQSASTTVIGSASDFLYYNDRKRGGLFINSVYCGGNKNFGDSEVNDEHSFNYCSHNFIELANTAKDGSGNGIDLNLDGYSIQYGTNGTDWIVLPLKGVIKYGSTFVIRGAQCSVYNSDKTKIKIDKCDMNWKDTTYSNSSDGMIQFSNRASKFFLTYGTSATTYACPYIVNGTVTSVTKGYIDLVGFQDETQSTLTVDGYEKSKMTGLRSSRLFCRYYNLDNTYQAISAWNKRDNSVDWYYVDLTKNDGEQVTSISDYTPKVVSDNKNISFNKSKLDNNKPTIVTCTFGRQATADYSGSDLKNGATRCFTWISVPYRDEFIWIRKSGNEEWTINKESFKEGDNRSKYNYSFYNRKTVEFPHDVTFTSHKVIVTDLSAETYEYVVGAKGSDGNPDFENCSDIKKFIVRNTNEVSGTDGFKFIQTTDQQGFNHDEYMVWKYTCDYISKEYSDDLQFMINTGDMTQNGNRIGEWIDYFSSKTEGLSELEEMATVGNNDLYPSKEYAEGDGQEGTKVNSNVFSLFFTFEVDEDNLPIFNNVFIPSIYSFDYGNTHFLCINSEISEAAETDVFGCTSGKILYPLIKEWCQKDIDKASSKTWKIAYCHEMPFTIITSAQTTYGSNAFYNTTTKKENSAISRGGSRLNTNCPNSDSNNQCYWFSEFCQDNGIRLVIGGHKHTQATTWPLRENVSYSGSTRIVNTFKPIIEVTTDDLNESFDSDGLYTITDTDSELYGFSYPNGWFKTDDLGNTTFKSTDYESKAHFCTFIKVTGITAPVYAMSQSSGYKHTSNKELPAQVIPWERYYYPVNTSGNVNGNQKYPFFTIWTVTNDKIVGDVKKVNGIFNNGVFKVYLNTDYINKGKCSDGSGSDISIVNGISPNDSDSDKQIIIKK